MTGLTKTGLTKNTRDGNFCAERARFFDLQSRDMKKASACLLISLCGLMACNKSATPAGPASSSAQPADAVQQKLQQSAGANATNCGRFDVQAAPDKLKTASDCALQANQSKRPFYIAYDMPGMTIGVAGNSEAKLFTVQSQGTDSANLATGDCPSQLRVASSGRVTCFAPGDMGSMGAGHSAGAIPPGMANPHGGDTSNPHGAAPKSK